MAKQPVLDDELRAALAPEIKALEDAAYERGKKDASGTSSVMATAETLAARARELQGANPALTSAAAVRAAYQEAGVPLE